MDHDHLHLDIHQNPNQMQLVPLSPPLWSFGDSQAESLALSVTRPRSSGPRTAARRHSSSLTPSRRQSTEFGVCSCAAGDKSKSPSRSCPVESSRHHRCCDSLKSSAYEELPRQASPAIVLNSQPPCLSCSSPRQICVDLPRTPAGAGRDSPARQPAVSPFD